MDENPYRSPKEFESPAPVNPRQSSAPAARSGLNATTGCLVAFLSLLILADVTQRVWEVQAGSSSAVTLFVGLFAGVAGLALGISLAIRALRSGSKQK